MSSQQVLMVDPRSLLNSQHIQIIHKHPDFSHKIRSDLDPYEFIAISYPINLANKLIPFLETPTCPVTSTTRTRSPKRQKTVSPTRGTKRALDPDTDSDIPPNKKTALRKSSPSKISNNKGATTTTVTTSITQSLSTLPTPNLTPDRRSSPPESFTPATINTAHTSRTISPGGTAFSPIKPAPFRWSAVKPSQSQSQSQSHTTNLSVIPPSALFTPPKPPPSTVPKAPISTTTTFPRTYRSRNPPTLIHFDAIPTSLDYRTPLPTLCLRHDLPTQSLRDVLEWCLVSTRIGKIIDLNGWMIQFRDTYRVRGIIEVCRGLGLERMGRVAERLLERMESGFGMM